MPQRIELRTKKPRARQSDTVSGPGYLRKCAECLSQVAALRPRHQKVIAPFVIVAHIQQHQGLVRENQEDTAAVMSQQLMIDTHLVNAYVLQISDGCGGMAGGEIASLISCREILKSTALFNLFPFSCGNSTGRLNNIRAELKSAYECANSAILQAVEHAPQFTGMASTSVSAVVLDNAHLWVAWTGDSRAYLYRRGDIKLLTKDHNRIRILVDTNIITPEEACTHPARNQLTKALGMRDDASPEIVRTLVEPGDLLILTTDGFHEGLSEELMCQLCAEHLSEPVDHITLQSLAAEMQEQSLDAYGGDNLTAVFAYVQPLDQSAVMNESETRTQATIQKGTKQP